MLILAAHPGDEVIGAGAHIPAIPDLWVVHVTDGAPYDRETALQHGFATREQYAMARQREARSALKLGGVGPERILHLEFPDQEVVRCMPALVRRLLGLFRGLQPDSILAPPYEGGHPDHDAIALAARAASQWMKQEEGRAPRIVEYALYHAWQGQLRAGDFLPRPCAVASLALEPAARVLKCRMLACLATQRQTSSQFQTEVERFRAAPLYNFDEPPHHGRLHYENAGGVMGSDEWRRHARATIRDLAVA